MNKDELFEIAQADTGEDFIRINPDSRETGILQTQMLLGVESDKDTQRKHFICKKIVGDNVDLSKYVLRINWKNAIGEKGQYLITDVSDKGEDITFSWLIGRNVTLYKGKVQFILCATKTLSDGTIQNEWNTTLGEGTVKEGLEVAEPIVEEPEKDTIAQLLQIAQDSAKSAKRSAEDAKRYADMAAGGKPILEKLIFTGAVNAEYDGSKSVTVNIPEGGGVNPPEPPKPPAGDTTVVIAEKGKATMSDGTLETYETPSVFGTTPFYDIFIPANETHVLRYYIPCSETDRRGGIKAQFFLNEQLVDYWTILPSILPSGKGSEEFWSVGSSKSDINKFRLCVYLNFVDDSYLFDEDTGKVYFAGKNSKYYGLANIDGTPAGQDVTTLTFDRDYAQDYNLPYTQTKPPMNILPESYAQAIEQAKKEWMVYCNGDVNKIPLVIHTDQHSGFDENIYKYLGKTLNWYEISKVINLGDTVNSWGDADKENPTFKNNELENYLKYTNNIPYSKRIEIFGNHDTWGDTELAPQNYLYKYFRNVYAKRFDNYGNFVLLDEYYNVKYLVVSGFAYDNSLGGKSHYIIPSASIDMLIDEMEKEDGYDIVILSHNPLASVSRENIIDPTTGGYPQWDSQSVNFKSLDDLWIARKNKTAGSVIDEYGITHSFDFAKCNSELLCGLHGHQHEDGYYYLGDNNRLLDAFFDAYYIKPKAFYFVVIDKINSLLNVWKIEDTPRVQNYQIPL